jgi:hypothetical protein
MVSLVALTAALVIFAADFGFGFRVTWSVYPLLAVGFVWLAATAAIALARRLRLLLAGETVVLSGFLYALSRLAESGGWFMPIALPVVVMIALLVGIASTVIVRRRLATLPAIAVIVLCTGFFVVGLEASINNYLDNGTPVSWSLVAFACAFSLFFLILSINRRLRDHHAEYRKIFHL